MYCVECEEGIVECKVQSVGRKVSSVECGVHCVK